jgi:hypothetical protein
MAQTHIKTAATTHARSVQSADAYIFFTYLHFYFDKMKSFMIESESLLRQQFCPGGGALLKKVGSQKRLSLRKIVVDSRNRFGYVVRLVATQVLVAALVFENRIAVVK